jgi:hypothetical protein
MGIGYANTLDYKEPLCWITPEKIGLHFAPKNGFIVETMLWKRIFAG